MDLYVYEPDGVCRETDERIIRTEYHSGKKTAFCNFRLQDAVM